MRRGFMKSVLTGLTALSVAGCCKTPDFNVGDMSGRMAFSGSVAFDFDFDADMEFDFGGSFSAWGRLGAATAASLDLDITGKLAFEQQLDVDIDDDGVEETVSVIGFGDDADHIDTVVASWEGDKYTFDDGYCYVLVWANDTLTELTGPCDGNGPVLTCTSPDDNPDDVSCEVCDENGSCARCESRTVEACIDEGSDALAESTPEPEPSPLPDAGSPPATTERDAAAPDAGTPTPPDAAAPIDTGNVEPQMPPQTNTAEYQACLGQVSALEVSVSLCGLSLALDASQLCEGNLAAVGTCFSSIDALGLLDSPCSVLQSNDCNGVVQ